MHGKMKFGVIILYGGEGDKEGDKGQEPLSPERGWG
jgi:hypothetical protein